MTNLVSQLVGALEELLHECEQGIATSPHARIEARAALSEAKAGGWVLPEGKRVIVVDDSFDKLIYWVDRAVSKGNANTDIQEAYEAWTGWDTYPISAPPAQRGEG